MREEAPSTWIHKDMAGVYAPHYDLVMITNQVRIWRIERVLIDEGRGSNILFSNCFERMKLPQDVINADTGDLYGFDGHKSNPVGCALLNVMINGKSLTVEFLLMDCKSPYNVILG